MKMVDNDVLALKKKTQRAETERKITPTLFAEFEASHFSCAGGDLHSLRHMQPQKRFTLSSARYIFSTEGHLLPATPQVSLVSEQCSYIGAYCKSSNSRQETYSSDDANHSGGTNISESLNNTDAANFLSHPGFQKSRSSGLIKGYCPGLTHGQRYGISYVASDDSSEEESSSTKQAADVIQNSSTVSVVSNESNHSSEYSPSSDVVDEDHDNHQEPEKEDARVPQLDIEASQIVNGTHKQGRGD